MQQLPPDRQYIFRDLSSKDGRNSELKNENNLQGNLDFLSKTSQ